MDRTRRFRVEGDDAARLDLLVARRLDLSRSQAATLIATGAVLVDGNREKASFRATDGNEVVVVLSEVSERAVEGEDIPLSILYEDDELLVVDKPAGMVVHPAPGNWTGTLVNALKGRGQALAGAASEERAGLVHRLDKDTSGLIVVAKTDRTLRVLGKAISERRVARRYAVLSLGHVEKEFFTVDKPIARDPNDRKRMAVAPAGRPARTDFYRLARFDTSELLRAHLHSGRTHQIRVHLEAIGHPVAGDDTYRGGGARRLTGLPPKRHFLHAAWLVFNHPVSGEILDFRSKLPEELRQSLISVSEMADLIAHPDPLEYLGFYRVDG